MTTRTTKRTVTFSRPFKLGTSDVVFPAGRYFIETDEDLVDELSFPFYRRTATMMQLIADPLRPGITETAVIDPLELEAALAADSAPMPEPQVVPSRPGPPAESTTGAELKAPQP